jgi:hypothetical protein
MRLQRSEQQSEQREERDPGKAAELATDDLHGRSVTSGAADNAA